MNSPKCIRQTGHDHAGPVYLDISMTTQFMGRAILLRVRPFSHDLTGERVLLFQLHFLVKKGMIHLTAGVGHLLYNFLLSWQRSVQPTWYGPPLSFPQFSLKRKPQKLGCSELVAQVIDCAIIQGAQIIDCAILQGAQIIDYAILQRSQAIKVKLARTLSLSDYCQFPTKIQDSNKGLNCTVSHSYWYERKKAKGMHNSYSFIT